MSYLRSRPAKVIVGNFFPPIEFSSERKLHLNVLIQYYQRYLKNK